MSFYCSYSVTIFFVFLYATQYILSSENHVLLPHLFRIRDTRWQRVSSLPLRPLFCPVPVGWLSYLIGASKPYNYKHHENCALLGYYATSSGNILTSEMGPIGCPETSVTNYHYSQRNNPEERISHLFRGGSLKSRIQTTYSL
jgi:hypothetical protein